MNLLKRIAWKLSIMAMLGAVMGMPSIWPSPPSDKTAADVFITFASKHYGENYDQEMSKTIDRQEDPSWSQRLRKRTRNWKEDEARYFLNFMVRNFGEQKTLELLASFSTAVRRGLTFKRFINNFKILASWAGRKAAIESINPSFKGFKREIEEETIVYFHQLFRRNKTEPHEMMQFLEVYLMDNHSPHKETLISSLQDLFARQGRLKDLDGKVFINQMKSLVDELGISDYGENFIRFVEDYLHSLETIKEMLLHNPHLFSVSETEEFDQMIDFLQEQGFSKEEIENIFAKHMRAGIKRKVILESFVSKLKVFFDAREVRQIIRHIMLEDRFYNLLSDVMEKEFSLMIDFLQERGIPKISIKESLQTNPLSIFIFKEPLENVAEHLEKYFGGGKDIKETINLIMLDDLREFIFLDTKEFDSLTIFLQGRGISKDAIKNMMKKNPSTIFVRQEELAAATQQLDIFFGGGTEAQKIVNQLMLDDLRAVAAMRPSEFDAVVAFLQERGLSLEIIREMVKENPSLLLVGLEKLKKNVERLEAFFPSFTNRIIRDDLWGIFIMEEEDFNEERVYQRLRKVHTCHSLVDIFF